MPERKRRCRNCGAALSSYNSGLLCFPCQKKKKEQLQEQIGDTPHYTISNLCFILGLSHPESVKRLGRKGIIPGRIPGIRQHLYVREEVDRWILGNEPQKAATGTIYESHTELSIKPPVTDMRNPSEFNTKYALKDLELETKSERILIESLQVFTSDTKVRYKLMLFVSNPRKLSDGLDKEDIIQMKETRQRIYTYPSGNPYPYINGDGKKLLYAVICVFMRDYPINFLNREMNDEKQEYLEREVNFTFRLRYRVI